MKDAKEWVKESVKALVSSDPEVWPAFLRRVQADAIEAAAKVPIDIARTHNDPDDRLRECHERIRALKPKE